MDNAERHARLRTAYDRAAPAREDAASAAWKHEERESVLTTLRANHVHTLLELGAGTGKDAQWFVAHGLDVTCVDLAPAMVARCRAKGLRAFEMDYAALDFAASAFDGAYAMNSLLHLPKCDWRTALDGIARVLAPGALFYLGVYGGHHHDGEWAQDSYTPRRHFTFHTDADVQRVVAEVFDVVTFHTVASEPHTATPDRTLHFQSLLLRRRA